MQDLSLRSRYKYGPFANDDTVSGVAAAMKWGLERFERFEPSLTLIPYKSRFLNPSPVRLPGKR
jgi:hypothetical protein